MINRFFIVPIFILLGLELPIEQWKTWGWGGVFAAVCIVFGRRIPTVLMLRPFYKSLHTWREILFLSWFGPVGIAALFYATYAHHKTGSELVWPLTSLVITVSLVLHGLTATPFSRWLGRTQNKEAREDQHHQGQPASAEG